MKNLTLNKVVMKKLFSTGALMLSILSLGSCSSEMEMPDNPIDKTTRITLSVPAEVVSRSFATGEHANQLSYAVYIHGENNTPGALVASETKEVTFDNNGSYPLEIELVNGKAYDFIFWADNKDAGAYTFDAVNHTITMTDAAFTSNNDKVDAFYGTLTTPVIDGAYSGNVSLYRPFAQLNLGASDLDDELFNNVQEIDKNKVYTKLTVSTYRSFDIWSGTCAGDAEKVTYSMPADAIDTQENLFPYMSGIYKYVSMHYLLMPKKTADQASDIVGLTYEFYNAPDATDSFYSIEVPNVPVRQNYRTNIYGQIFTDLGTITVDIQSGIYDMTWPIGAKVITTADELINAVKTVKSGSTLVIPAGTTINIDAKFIDGNPENDITGDFIEPTSDIEIRVDGTLAFTGVSQIAPMNGAKVTLSGEGTITSESEAFLLRAEDGDIAVNGNLTLKTTGIAGVGYAINGHSLDFNNAEIVGEIKTPENPLYIPNSVLGLGEGGNIKMKNTTVKSNAIICSHLNYNATIGGAMTLTAEDCQFINNAQGSDDRYFKRYAFETYSGKAIRYEFINSPIASNTGCVHVYSGGTLIFKGNGKITGNARMSNFKNTTEFGKIPVVVESGATGIQFNNYSFVYNEWNEEDSSIATVMDKGATACYMMASYYTGPTHGTDGNIIAAYKGYSWKETTNTFNNGKIMDLNGDIIDKTSVFRYCYSK